MKRPLILLATTLPGMALAQTPPTPDWASHFDPAWYNVAFDFAYWQMLAIGLLLIGSILAAWMGRRILRRVAHAWRGESPALRGLNRALGILVGLLLWYLALPELALEAAAERNVRYGVEAMTIVAVAWFFVALWDSTSDRLAERAGRVDQRAEKLLVPVIGKLVRAAVLTVAFLVALGVFGVNVAGLLAGIGIGGLVIALAAKDSVENILGSLSLIFDMPFAIGDLVRIGTIEGTIEEINLRSTRIRAADDVLVTLPNSNLVRTSVENLTARIGRRQRFHVRLSNDTPPEKLELFLARLRAFMEKSSPAQAGRSIVELNELSVGSIGVLVQCFFDVATYAEEMRLRNDLMLEILRMARETGVSMAQQPPPPHTDP